MTCCESLLDSYVVLDPTYNFGGSLFCLEFFSMDDRQLCILILALIQLLMFRRRQLIFRRHIRLLMMRICSDTRFWILMVLFLNRTLFLNEQSQPTRVWVIDRPQYWLEIHYADPFSRSYWKQNFRVSARTFEYICRLVAASISKHGTNMCDTILSGDLQLVIFIGQQLQHFELGSPLQ